jgi:hypothetical protein
MPSALLKVVAEWRNRIETTFSEITDRMEHSPATEPTPSQDFSQDSSNHRPTPCC